MRKLITVAAFVLAVCCAPVAASASTGISVPLTSPRSMTAVPPGFTTDARQAIDAAEATRTMQALHRRDHPLNYTAQVYHGTEWWVDFYFHGKRVSEVVVNSIGRVTRVWTGPQAIAIYARGHYAPIFDSPWVVIPFSLLFLVPFVDPRRFRRMVLLDALGVLSFLISYAMFDRAKLVPAVWLVYPPLIYLLGRMLWIGFGRTRDSLSAGLPGWLSTRTLLIGLLVLIGARIALSLFSHIVIDVGYASVIGAHRILHGQSLYWAGAAHGDTYGPIAYLAYVPFELAFPWHGAWDYLISAHAAALAFDLLTILGLVVLGRRLRPGAGGKRLGLALGWAWAACPFTLLVLMLHTDDGLVAMLSVWALVAFASPAGRGVLVGLAAAAKFAPAALLPLFAGGYGRARGAKQWFATTAAFTVVVAGSIALFVPAGGLSEFYNHTIGFQLTRTDVFSPWALHPGLAPLKVVIEAGALLLAAAVAFVPRERSLRQVAALAAAITIAVQLPALHWFYYYIAWFLPFVLVALLASERPAAAPEESAAVGHKEAPAEPQPEPALAGV
jgi:hypothetical protein